MVISIIGLPIIVFFACELIYPVLSYITTTTIASEACDFLVVFFLMVAFVGNIQHIRIMPWLLAIACLCAFGLSAWFYPEYRKSMFETANIWEWVFAPQKGIVLMLILTLIKDPEEIFKALKVSAVFVWLAYTFRVISGAGLSQTTGTNHVYGYAFLFVSIMFTLCFIREKKRSYLVIAILALGQVILYASRTAILSYVVFLALYALCYDNNKKLCTRKIILIFLGVFFSFVLTSELFLNLLSAVLHRLGISSKILEMFIYGNIELDGGRERSYTEALALLWQNPLGLGVYWDRYYCEFSYVHNIILEILVDYEWLLGGAIIIILIKNIVEILRSNEKTWKLLLILFFSLSMVRLMLSYSLWLDTNFWGMIAVIIGYRYSVKSKKRSAFSKMGRTR